MTDTSKEAVETFIKTELTEIARSTGLLVSEEDVEACKEAAAIMRTLLYERDALRAQLQAARGALKRIESHYTDTALAPFHMQAIARAALKSTSTEGEG
ncbi:hypothetical protein [Phaeobacter sp. JH204B]|uniref:hypothetical protein n=1 Tax=Phaeobacter sp. JH204B TaxID=3112503 RepID=UPI003A83A200